MSQEDNILGRIKVNSALRFKDWELMNNEDYWSEAVTSRYSLYESIHDLEKCVKSYVWKPARFILMQGNAENVRSLQMLAALFTHKYLSSSDEIVQLDHRVTVSKTSSVLTEINKLSVERPKGDASEYYEHTSLVRAVQVPNYLGRVYDRTEVRVTQMNALDVACQLRLKYPTRSIVYVNVADRTRRGGQWKSGYFGQEEYLYARSGMSLATRRVAYPLGRWACLYTRGLRVVRLGEEHGYRFIPPEQQPRIDVVTVAGEDPDTSFFADHRARLRVKLEAAFSHCVEHDADTVVLGSAFAGYEPLFLTAALRAVLEQFAGTVRAVYVGSCLGTAPEESGWALCRALMGPSAVLTGKYCCLDDFDEAPPAVYIAPPAPWASALTATDLSKPVCKDAGECRATDPEHYTTYEHPPFCPCGEQCCYCRYDDDNNNNNNGGGGGGGGNNYDELAYAYAYHKFLYLHRHHCPDSGRCRLATSLDADERTAHTNRFYHPEPPPQGAHCDGSSAKVCAKCFDKYLYYPSSNIYKSLNPPNNAPQAHTKQAARAKVLPYFEAHNKQSISAKVFCYRTPYCKTCNYVLMGSSDSKEVTHLETHMHICDKGKYCLSLSNDRHLKHFAHTSLTCSDPACPYGGYHKNLLRKECPDKSCTNFDEEHRKTYAHHLPSSAIAPIPIACSHWPEPLSDRNSYAYDNVTVKDVAAWVATLRPTLPCSIDVLRAYMALGLVMGPGEARAIWECDKEIVRIVIAAVDRRDGVAYQNDTRENSTVDKVNHTAHALRHVVWALQEEVCRKYEDRKSFDPSIADLCVIVEERVRSGKMDSTLSGIKESSSCSIISSISSSSSSSSSNSSGSISSGGSSGSSGSGDGCDGDRKKERLKKKYEIAAREVIEALECLAFSEPCVVFGPHPCDYEGCDALITFREDVMHHPDFYVYATDGTVPAHTMNPRWGEAVAKALIRATSKSMGGNPVTLRDVVERWSTASSIDLLKTGFLRAHIPARVPFECIERIFSTKEVPEKDMPPVVVTEDLYTSAFKLEPAHHPMMAGLCFALSAANKKEIYCPTFLPDGEADIKFRARGGDFYFSLHARTPMGPKRIFTFYVDGTARSVILYEGRGLKEPLENGFNDGCNTDEFVEYKVTFSRKERKVRVQHWGCALVFNTVARSLIIPEGLNTVDYISFYSDATKSLRRNYDATIAGFTIEKLK